MFLSPHFLAGAAISETFPNLGLAVLFSLASHYALDMIPHKDYSISKIRQKDWIQSAPDFFKIGLDFLFSFFLVFFLADRIIPALICGFAACLPDFWTFLSLFFPKSKILSWHLKYHKKIQHFSEEKQKETAFWQSLKTATPIIAIIALTALLAVY